MVLSASMYSGVNSSPPPSSSLSATSMAAEIMMSNSSWRSSGNALRISAASASTSSVGAPMEASMKRVVYSRSSSAHSGEAEPRPGMASPRSSGRSERSMPSRKSPKNCWMSSPKPSRVSSMLPRSIPGSSGRTSEVMEDNSVPPAALHPAPARASSATVISDTTDSTRLFLRCTRTRCSSRLRRWPRCIPRCRVPRRR